MEKAHWQHPSDYVGICHTTIWAQPRQYEVLLEKIHGAGIGWVRKCIRWSQVEPEAGRFDFSGVDPLIRGYESKGIRILGTFLSIPRWANGTEGRDVVGWADAYPPGNMEDWRRYVGTVVTRYRDTIHHWEVWNEQNGIDFFRPMPDEFHYVELLRAAYEECKKVQPDCTVLLGGLQMNGVVPNPWSPVKIENFLARIYEAGGKPYFDVVNIHPYILCTDPIDKMTGMIQGTIEVMERYEDENKPIWITEVGCGTNICSREDQAYLLCQTLFEARKIPQVQRVFWYCLQDAPEHVGVPENSMGLLTRNLEEKPAYQAIRGMIR